MNAPERPPVDNDASEVQALIAQAFDEPALRRATGEDYRDRPPVDKAIVPVTPTRLQVAWFVCVSFVCLVCWYLAAVAAGLAW